jgi:hypothetical protein
VRDGPEVAEHPAEPRPIARMTARAVARADVSSPMAEQSCPAVKRQETAAFTSATTRFSTAGLHFLSANDAGHMSPSSRFAVSWKPRVE